MFFNVLGIVEYKIKLYICISFKNKYKQFIHTIMKATKKTVESVEYWLEGCSSYFQETKEEFWNGINAGFRGFYFFKYTDGSYSDSIYAKSFERL